MEGAIIGSSPSVRQLMSLVRKVAVSPSAVLLRGESVMVGYRGDPERTAEAIDSEGWLHTGDIELRDNGDITGIAANLAARVEQACDDGGIFVSSTVCDLMLGSDATFDDRGERTLKGFDQPWRLFSLVGHH